MQFPTPHLSHSSNGQEGSQGRHQPQEVDATSPHVVRKERGRWIRKHGRKNLAVGESSAGRVRRNMLPVSACEAPAPHQTQECENEIMYKQACQLQLTDSKGR